METAPQPMEAPTSSQSAQLNHKNSPKKPSRRNRERRPDMSTQKISPFNRPDKSRNDNPSAKKNHYAPSSIDEAPKNRNSSTKAQEPGPSSSKQEMLSPSRDRSCDTIQNQAVPALKLSLQKDPSSPKRPPKKGFQPYKANDRSQGSEENGEPQQRPSRRARRGYDQDEDAVKKVIVTGFPAYTQVEDLVRVLSPFGAPAVDTCKNRMAVVAFQSAAEAAAALRAHEEIVVYGEIVSVHKYTNRKHVADIIRSNRRVSNKETKGPEITAPADIDLTGDFYQQLKNIEDAIRLTQEEVAAVGRLFADIETVLKPIWPACRAVPFGSITTGLGIKSSDADCFLELAPGAGAGAHSGAFVRKAARALRMRTDLFAHLVPIPTANTPIIKFLHVPTNVHCDLNSKTPLGAQNSRLIRHLLAADARLGPLALLLKYWARVHQLTGTGRITNYALLMLLIFYLQPTILPPVARLQSAAHSFVVEHWEAGFDPAPLPPARAAPRAPLRDLLGGFFVYYDSFDFEHLVASPLMGEPLKKALFEGSGEKLPKEMYLYSQNVQSRFARPLRTSSCMCIQDPFELCHNVASSVSPRLFAELKAQIALAAAAYTRGDAAPGDFLRSALLERAPPAADDARPDVRLALPARLLAGLREPWRDIVREVVVQSVFGKMLDIELERRDDVSKEPEVDIEVYSGSVTRPVWKRSKQSNGRGGTTDESVARHAALTARLPPRPAPLHLPIQVELGFCEEPRRLWVTASAGADAEPGAYREFRKFAHAFLRRWTRDLLRPHLRTPVWASSAANDTNTRPQPRASVSFTNSHHKQLGDSIARISLGDELSHSDCSDT